MPESPQRAGYIAAQIESIHQNLRFLEHVVAQPAGLVSDLRSLRAAIGLAGSATDRDRLAFLDVTDPDDQGPTQRSRRIAVVARDMAERTVELVSALAPGGADALPEGWAEWRPRAAKVLERARAQLGASVRAENGSRVRGLYVIVDPEHTRGRPPLDIAAAALQGGATIIQYRDKLADGGAFLDLARAMKTVCDEHNALFIVNDDAAAARVTGADGLHVGQSDLPVPDARNVLADDQIVGQSTHSVQEALESEAQSADYVAVGALFRTGTKAVTHPVTLDTLAEIKRRVRVPVVAIGGISMDNVRPVVEAGADAACVITAVSLADDPEKAARDLAGVFGGRPNDGT